MAGRLTRRKIAAYAADKIISGTSVKSVLREIAAYLVDTRRTRETDLIVREIEDTLAEKGAVVADVTTAYPLSDSLRDEVKKLVGGKTVYLRENIDESVLGGVLVDIPGQRFDGTIRRKLTALRAKQL
jgi:F0F1-type ATP synthase delta subunit